MPRTFSTSAGHNDLCRAQTLSNRPRSSTLRAPGTCTGAYAQPATSSPPGINAHRRLGSAFARRLRSWLNGVHPRCESHHGGSCHSRTRPRAHLRSGAKVCEQTTCRSGIRSILNSDEQACPFVYQIAASAPARVRSTWLGVKAAAHLCALAQSASSQPRNTGTPTCRG